MTEATADIVAARPTASRPLRCAVIGLGVGARHAARYEAHPACHLVAVCDRDPTTLGQFTVSRPGLRGDLDARRMLEDIAAGRLAVDILSIASEDSDHGQQIIAALDAGVHVFTEKPMCTRRSEADLIAERLARPGAPRLGCNLVLRRTPRFRALAALAQGPRLGVLHRVRGEYLYGRLHKLIGGWRGADPTYSVMLGGGVHMIDVLQWLAMDRVMAVQAVGNRRSTLSMGSDFPRPDTVSATLCFESGMIGTITVDFGCVRPHGHRVELCGDAGSAVSDPDRGIVHVSRDPAIWPEPIPSATDLGGRGSLLDEFIDAVVRGAEDPIDHEDIFDGLAACFAIERSLALADTDGVAWVGPSVDVEPFVLTRATAADTPAAPDPRAADASPTPASRTSPTRPPQYIEPAPATPATPMTPATSPAVPAALAPSPKRAGHDVAPVLPAVGAPTPSTLRSRAS